jgi:hypothetical protein
LGKVIVKKKAGENAMILKKIWGCKVNLYKLCKKFAISKTFWRADATLPPLSSVTVYNFYELKLQISAIGLVILMLMCHQMTGDNPGNATLPACTLLSVGQVNFVFPFFVTFCTYGTRVFESCYGMYFAFVQF